MGIKGLPKFLQTEAAKGNNTDPSKLKEKFTTYSRTGQTAAIDLLTVAIGKLASANKRYIEEYLRNKNITIWDYDPTNPIHYEPVNTLWFVALADYFSAYIANGINIICVTDDNLDNKHKQKERDKRHKTSTDKKAEIARLQEEGDPLSIKDTNSLKSKLSAITIKGKRFALLSEFLRILGIPDIKYKGESENFCAALCLQGAADFMVSTDTDCLLFPVKVATDVNYKLITFWNREYVLDVLRLDEEYFLEFCIAIGCDFNTNIPGVGPARVMKLLKSENVTRIEDFVGRTVVGHTITEEDIEGLNPCICRKLLSPSEQTVSKEEMRMFQCDQDGFDKYMYKNYHEYEANLERCLLINEQPGDERNLDIKGLREMCASRMDRHVAEYNAFAPDPEE